MANVTESFSGNSGFVSGEAINGLGLFTDLYELTMLQAYYNENMTADATFSLFVRNLPEHRNFLIAGGLEPLLQDLERLRFSDEDLAYLRSLNEFTDDFLTWLADFKFTGSVRAVPEGTPVFGHEPLLEVTAPLPQAQIIETLVMNQIHMQTVLASKAYRVAKAAQGRPVLDFGARRIHGVETAVKGARAFYIGGVAATSNLLAGRRYGVPVAGTMAHSYIQAHDNETRALEAFAETYPETVLLVDTFDTLEGVQKVIRMADKLGGKFKIKGVRLDSGDLGELARQSRKALDDAGLDDVEVIVSGGLQENAIAELLDSGAPIDGFGVGTSMGVAEDAPAMDIAYKLVAYAGKGRLKLSSGKKVLPGSKQIFRQSNADTYCGDIIGRQNENLPGQPLLEEVMRDGVRVGSRPRDVHDIRDYAKAQIAKLPDPVQSIRKAEAAYSVDVSEALQAYQREVEDWVATQNK